MCKNLYRRFLSSPWGPSFKYGYHDPTYKARQKATRSLVRGDPYHRLLSLQPTSVVKHNNNLSGRSWQAPCQCPVSANAMATQLVINGKYKSAIRKSSHLVSREVSNLWKTTPLYPKNVTGEFTPRKFSAACSISSFATINVFVHFYKFKSFNRRYKIL